VVLSLLLLALSCTGADDVSTAPTVEAVPASLIQDAWTLQVAQPGKLDEVLGQKAWNSVFERRYGAAAEAFGMDSARGHAEAAAIYRQSALLQANAILATFGEGQRRDTDPAELTYLVGVASVIAGDLETARASLGQGGDNVGGADSAWLTALEAESFTLADAPGLFELGDVVVGGAPALTEAPHYHLPEGESGLFVDVADPTLTLQLAFWHEQAAKDAGGDWVDSWLSPWRLPLEEDTAQPVELPLDALFLGVWLTSADLDFVNALDSTGDAALEQFAGTSSYAKLVSECAGEDEVDVDCLLDRSVSLGAQLEAAMQVAYGSQHADHRTFASFARAGVLRAGARLCDSRGDERTAAILRLNARDRGTGPATDPKFQLSLAAWDASNRNALRSTELFHPNRAAVPGLDVVQVSLDTFSLRVGRETGAGIPQ
jgi:hypothetical protein